MSADTHLIFSLGDDDVNFGLIVRVLGQPVVANHDGVHPEQSREAQVTLVDFNHPLRRTVTALRLFNISHLNVLMWHLKLIYSYTVYPMTSTTVLRASAPCVLAAQTWNYGQRLLRRSQHHCMPIREEA